MAYTYKLKLDETIVKEQDKKLLNLIAQAIYDKKGFNILVLDVSHLNILTDYLVIAEGHIDRHLQAIADEIIVQLEKNKLSFYKMEGKESGGWLVIDYLNIIIHLFIPSFRQKYMIERLWQKGDIVDVNLVLEQKDHFKQMGEL